VGDRRFAGVASASGPPLIAVRLPKHRLGAVAAETAAARWPNARYIACSCGPHFGRPRILRAWQHAFHVSRLVSRSVRPGGFVS